MCRLKKVLQDKLLSYCLDSSEHLLLGSFLGKGESPREVVLAILRSYLKREDIWIGHKENGRPFLESDPEMPISISHCNSCVAVLMSDVKYCSIGIDVEDKWSQANRLLPRFTTQEERVILQEAGLEAIWLWSAKESCYKAFSERISRFTKDIVLVGIQQDHLLLHLKDIGLQKVVYQLTPYSAVLTYVVSKGG